MMFRLALALGRTVREIEQGMDSQELSEWIAYTNIEPLPDAWQIGAQQCALMANLWTTGRRYTPQDFLPADGTRKKQSKEEQRAAMRAFANRHNAKVGS